MSERNRLRLVHIARFNRPRGNNAHAGRSRTRHRSNGMRCLHVRPLVVLRTVLERDDRRGRAAEHALGLRADGEHAARLAVDGDHRGLPQHDSLTFDIDEGVGGAQVDAHVVREQAEEEIKH